MALTVVITAFYLLYHPAARRNGSNNVRIRQMSPNQINDYLTQLPSIPQEIATATLLVKLKQIKGNVISLLEVTVTKMIWITKVYLT